jgi:hypothetical protein
MLAANLLVYVPFRNTPDILYRNYDGPFYMYVAKTLYHMPSEAVFDEPLKNKYYASHLPAYPILIRLVKVLTGASYPVAMLLATTLSSMAAGILFYHLLRAWNLVLSPFWTSLLFCFFPPRWLLYHSVGASEPLFLCFIFAAFLALKNHKDWLVVLFITCASLTRIMGVLLIPCFIIIYAQRKEFKKIPLVCISLIGLSSLFSIYYYEFGDFFAYFRYNLQDKGMIQPYPFEVFRFYASKVNFHSTELYFMLYAVYGIGAILLWEKREFFIYSAIYLVFTCFIFHFDLPRHLIPLAPFALLVAFDSYLSKPAFKIVLVPILLYLGYVYVWGWLPYPLLPERGFHQLLLELR